jgi:hypothetical protein
MNDRSVRTEDVLERSGAFALFVDDEAFFQGGAEVRLEHVSPIPRCGLLWLDR